MVVNVSMFSLLCRECASQTAITTLFAGKCPISAVDVGQIESTGLQAFPTHEEPDKREVGTNGKCVLAACADGKLLMLDVRSRSVVTSCSCTAPLSCCCFANTNNNESQAVVGCEDGTISTWDLRAPAAPLVTIRRSPATITHVTPSGSFVWVATQDGAVFSLDINSGITKVDLTGPNCDPVTGIGVAPGVVITCCRDGVMRYYKSDWLSK